MRSILGVIGGSGNYDLPGLCEVTEQKVETPYGAPSDIIVSGRLGDTTMLFLPRHGRGHRLAPHRVNYRANICALKMLGATQVVSLSAVGSMRENLRPGDVVVVDQYVDFTRRRESTFFDQGIVAHVGLAEPVCAQLVKACVDAATRAGATVHDSGTYLCIEGPQFSTRAESLLYRSWNIDVIGMTALPEAKLAREAGLAYATVAFVTDYDCWHADHESVSVQAVVEVLRQNVALARRIVAELSADLPDPRQSIARGALQGAIMTDPSAIDPNARARLAWLLGSADSAASGSGNSTQSD